MHLYLWRVRNLQEKAWGANLCWVLHCCLGGKVFGSWGTRFQTVSSFSESNRKAAGSPGLQLPCCRVSQDVVHFEAEGASWNWLLRARSGFRPLLNALWLYRRWLQSLVGELSHLVCVMLIMGHHEKADGLHGGDWARQRALAPIHSKFIHKSFLRLWGSQSYILRLPGRPNGVLW